MIVVALLFAADMALATPDLTCRVRDRHGRVVRSMGRRNLFRKLTGFPKGRPGYVVDHTIPLTCGGCDTPANMAWLSIEEHDAKSRWERQPCKAWFDGSNTKAIASWRLK